MSAARPLRKQFNSQSKFARFRAQNHHGSSQELSACERLAENELNSLLQQALSYGAASLGSDELLALVMSEHGAFGLPPIVHARSLLEELGGLQGIAKARLGFLREREDLSLTAAARICAALELGRRAAQESLTFQEQKPMSKESVEAWARPRLAGLEHEEVWVICVNAQTSMQSAWQVGRGGIHGCGLLARDILVPVVRDSACAFILVHNHPSGDPTPSREDIELTRGLQLAAASICIPLLDHVVVAREGASSLFELGLLEH